MQFNDISIEEERPKLVLHTLIIYSLLLSKKIAEDEKIIFQ